MFDTAVVGGHLVDPAQGLAGRYDVCISNGCVAAIQPHGTGWRARPVSTGMANSGTRAAIGRQLRSDAVSFRPVPRSLRTLPRS